MSRLLRHQASLAVAAALATCCAATAAAAPTVAPLPESDYSVRPACSTPMPAHAGCLAVQLVPSNGEARRHDRPIGTARPDTARLASGAPEAGDFGYRPQDLHNAYDLPDTTTSGAQTIALVDAYNDPTAASDLAAYEQEFGLSNCTESDCFEQVNEKGQSGEANLPFPKSLAALKEAAASSNEEVAQEAAAAIGWGAEMSLDIETARAICQNCHILLVEAASTEYSDLDKAEETASRLGVTEISNSWGGPEESVSVADDDNGPFNRPGIVITASTGDDGFLGWDAENSFERGYPEYPAASPHVVAVGGTRLEVGAKGDWLTESVWNGDGATGGGCSRQFPAQSWQLETSDWSLVGCGGKRAEADVSADGDPFTGVAVTDSDDPGEECEGEYEGRPWCIYGGTSLASPLIASVFALAGGANDVSYPAETLYESLAYAPGTLHDITYGSNGECTSGFTSRGVSRCKETAEAAASCGGALVCLAGPGYDGPSGVGTPDGILGFEPGQYETPPVTEPPTPVRPAPEPAPVEAPVVHAAASTPLRVSGLALTSSSVRALHKHDATASKVSFGFVLSAFSRVRISLVREERLHGRMHWIAAIATISAPVASGHDSRHLSGGRRLPAGIYRLTVAPLDGAAQAIVFRVA